MLSVQFSASHQAVDLLQASGIVCPMDDGIFADNGGTQSFSLLEPDPLIVFGVLADLVPTDVRSFDASTSYCLMSSFF